MKKEKIKIIFDRDGVFNQLNRKVAETLGFMYDLFKVYHIESNPHFSEDMQAAIYRCYNDPKIFADVSPAQGYMDIARIKQDDRVRLIVNSLSSSKVIAKVKKEWDKKHGIDFFDEYLDCFGEKKQMQEAFIQVEDCIENIERSPAKFKILINQPYNQGEMPKNTFRVNGLTEAVEIILDLLKKEKAQEK